MPLKFIAFAALVALAAGYAVYEKEELRSEISQFVDRQRRRLAHHLQKLADDISPKERSHEGEAMMMGSRPGTREESGASRDFGLDQSDSNLRRRFGGGDGDQVVFDHESEKEKVKEEKESGYETMEKELPPSPPPPTAPARAASVASTATLSGAREATPHDPLSNTSSQQPYWSIPTWAEQTTSILTPVGSDNEFCIGSSEPSLAGSDEEDMEVVGDAEDALSEAPPMSETSEEFEEVGSVNGSLAGWCEVGSEVSGEEEGGRGRF